MLEQKCKLSDLRFQTRPLKKNFFYYIALRNFTVHIHSLYTLRTLPLFRDFHIDKAILQCTSKDLTDSIVNAAQALLKNQFPCYAGFQSTLLGEGLKFTPVDRRKKSVQILNTGMQSTAIVKLNSPYCCVFYRKVTLDMCCFQL